MWACSFATQRLITALTGILNNLLKAIARNCIAHVNYKNWGQVEFFPRSFRKAMALWGIIMKSKRMLGSCLKLDPWARSGFFKEIFHKPLNNIWYFLLANHAGYLSAVYFFRRLLAGWMPVFLYLQFLKLPLPSTSSKRHVTAIFFPLKLMPGNFSLNLAWTDLNKNTTPSRELP